jgi:hypothetical protein
LSSDVYFDAAGSPRVVNSLGPVDDLPPIDPTRMTRPNTNVGLGDIPGLARGARYNLHPLTAARNTGLGTALSNTLSPDASIFKPGTRLGPTPGRTGFADFATRLGPKAEPNFGAGKWGSTIRGGMRNFTGGLVTSGSAQFGADIMANGGFGRSQADADASMNQQGARGDAYRAVQGGLGTAAFAGFGAGPAGLAALPGGALGTYGASQLNRHFGWGESDDITPMDVLSGDNMKREARGAFAGISDNALREARGEDVNGNQISGEQALQAKIEATIGERNKLQASYDASIKLPGTDAAINPAAASDAYAANMLEVTQRQLEDYRDRVKQRMSMTGESFETAAQATEMRDPEMIRRGFADPEGDILDDTGQPIGKNREYLDALGKMSPEEANPVEQEFYTLDKFRDVAGQAWIDPKYTDQLIAERREQIRVGALTVENSPRPVPMETGEMAVDPNTGQQVPEYMGRNGEFTTKASEALTWQEAAQQAGMPVGEFYAKENEMAAYQSLVADLPNLAEQSKAEAQKTFQRNALMAQLNQMIPQLLAPYDAMAANSAYFSDPNRAAAFQNLAGLRKNAFYAEQQMAPILAQLEAEQQREQAVANSRQAIADEYYNNLWAIEQGYRQPPQQSQANYDLSSLIPAG